MDQCHSTVGTKPLVKPRAVPMEEVGVSSRGEAYWRDLDEVIDTPDFRNWLEREFPSGASELLASSRRTFVKLMGASLALAGVATIPGCRRPEQAIMPYSKSAPEDVVPGKALYFATAMPLPGGGAEGLLIETHEGRPTKVEGNPTHPVNNGKSSAWSQAAVLGIYDPDRVKNLTTADDETPRAWGVFDAWAAGHFKKFDASGGAGLAFIADKQSSPSRERLRQRIMQRWPQARWVSTYMGENAAQLGVTKAIFGKPMREVLNLNGASVILSLDRDFLGQGEVGHLRNSRDWSAKRKVMKAQVLNPDGTIKEPGDTMSRVYVAESTLTGTGAKADHRLSLEPAAIAALAVMIGRDILARYEDLGRAEKASADVMGPVGAVRRAVDSVSLNEGEWRAKGIDAAWVKAVCDDLWEARGGQAGGTGAGVVLAGATLPAEVQALVLSINMALGALGKTVQHYAINDDEGVPSAEALTALAGEMNAGRIDTVVCLNANPVYDAPGASGFAGAFARVPNRVTLSVALTETVAASTWKLHGAHFLESWGDVLADEGTQSAIQPMIAPIYDGRSELELLAVIAGEEVTSGYEIVRQTWRERLGLANDAEGFERSWRRALHNGWFGMSRQMRATMGSGDPGFDLAQMSAAIGRLSLPRAASDKAMTLVFISGMPGDGRFANCAWLQELPEPTTKVVWDNVAMMSPATAERFGLERENETVEQRRARMCTVTHDGRSITLPAWAVPGLPDNVIVLSVGYGRRVSGHVGDGVGVDVNPLRDAAGSGVLYGAKLERTSSGDQWYFIATTQLHGSMEGRAIVREIDMPVWTEFGANPLKDLKTKEEQDRLLVDSYGNKRVTPSGVEGFNLGERLGTPGHAGELTHTPSNINIYDNPQRGGKTFGLAEKNELGHTPDFAHKGEPQWGMSIDLAVCNGCNVCTVACQSENNIPVVGKIEVDKGREMHWIRVDRYYQGDIRSSAADAISMTFQPVACVHCENAPCETVCPVNATVHGSEGINYMVYNRCIGTRYCANNCPYKVRRFNFFDYGVKKYNGGYVGRETLEDAGIGGPTNTNLIPPRLRERLDEITKMQMNPDVTVRSRGVMEKCSYCIQRINGARAEVKVKNLKVEPGEASIPDGFFQAACQQACPTDAISYGDIHDKKSRVYAERNHQRTYALLGFLNTRPRTTYMIGMRNPNPVLVSAERKDLWAHPFGHHGGGHGDHGHGDHGHDGHGHEGDGHNHDHNGHGHGEGHSMMNFFDPAKAGDDRGYRLSLAVLGGRA